MNVMYQHMILYHTAFGLEIRQTKRAGSGGGRRHDEATLLGSKLFPSVLLRWQKG